MRTIALPFLLAAMAMTSFAQLQDDEDTQSWNDLQLTIPVSKQFDFFTKFTLRLGKNITRDTDNRIAVGTVWKPVKNLSISPFYMYVNARNAAGRFRVENRLNLAATYRYPFGKYAVSHRSTYERRYRGLVNSWRYRAIFIVERDLPEKWIKKTKFFVADEVFYDSLTQRFSRNRFGFGITKAINKQLTLDVYYTRQNDGFSHPGDLNIIWAAWKVRL